MSSILYGYVRNCEKRRELRARLSELEERGSLCVQSYGIIPGGHDVRDSVAHHYEACESLRLRISTLSAQIRKVERLRTRLFEIGRYSARHELMRLMMEEVYFAGQSCEEFSRRHGLSPEQASETRLSLLDFGALVMLA